MAHTASPDQVPDLYVGTLGGSVGPLHSMYSRIRNEPCSGIGSDIYGGPGGTVRARDDSVFFHWGDAHDSFWLLEHPDRNWERDLA